MAPYELMATDGSIYVQERRQRFLMEEGRYKDKPDDDKPFAHPYYWGAFVCNGKWD